MATTKVSTKLLETVGVAEGGTGATSSGAARTSLGLGTVATLDTVSVATGGTGATSASAARTALGLVIGTNVLAPNGSAASLTNLPAGGASAAEAANIMINSFNIAAAGGFAFQNMVDGVVDEFEDETGIDAGASTNESYDATSDFFAGGGILSTTNAVPDMTSATAPSGTVTASQFYNNEGNRAWNAFDRSTTTKWYSYTQQVSVGTPGWIAYDWGSGNGEIIQKYTLTSISNESTDRLPSDFKLYGWNGSTYVLLDTQTNQDGWGQPESRSFTFANTTSYEKYKLEITATDTGGDEYVFLAGFEMFGLSPIVNMTLVSNATTALAAPDDANIVIWQEDGSSAITLNTDLKAYASRNGGTTYTQMTLAEVANLTTGRILTGTVDISGQSSATAMKYKIETLNTKEQKIHAVALQWS